MLYLTQQHETHTKLTKREETNENQGIHMETTYRRTTSRITHRSVRVAEVKIQKHLTISDYYDMVRNVKSKKVKVKLKAHWSFEKIDAIIGKLEKNGRK